MQWSSMFVAMCLALLFVGDASAKQAAQEKYTHHGFRYGSNKMKMVEAEDFLIMPWGWTAGDREILEDIRDCGFNMAGFVSPQHVTLAARAGLKCIVDDPNVSRVVNDAQMSDEEIAKRVEKATARFRKNPNVYGYYVMDEPTAPLFPNLARWAAAITKAHPGSTPYINLLPIGAQGPGSKDYEDYIEQFVSVIKPTYVSYDHYTLMDDGSVRPSLYMNLEVMRKASLKHGIPFWNIVLGNSHFHYAEVTQGGLNLQVYATLAYGGKGICYFTYFAPLVGNYRNAAVDQFLNKTPTWGMLRLINNQIHALAPVYLTLKSVNVFHNEDVPDGCLGMDSSRHLAEVGGGSFLIGEFEDSNGVPYVLIVNKNIHISSAFHVKFKEPGAVMMTSPYTGQTYGFGGENGWLSPGAGILLSLGK